MTSQYQDAEKAVLCIYNQSSDPALRKQAQDYCDSVKNSDGALHIACGLMMRSAVQQVKFWCLQVLEDVLQHRYATLSDQDRDEVKKFLVSWILETCPAGPPQPPFLLNKVAQIYAILVRNDYPEQWPDALTILLSALNSGVTVIDMFLRVQDAVDAEIINSEFHRSPADAAVSMRVKDALRLQCLNEMASAWYVILREFYQSEPGLVKYCLSSISRYIHWIDIGLIMNDKFVPAFYALLENDVFVEEAAMCLTEMVLKKMEPVQKIHHIHSLVNKPFIENALATRATEPNKNAAALVRLAHLTGSVCKELLVNSDKISSTSPAEALQAQTQLQDLMPLALGCAMNENDDVSSASMEFVTIFVNSLKKLDPLPEFHLEQLSGVLSVLLRKLRYSSDFDFQNPLESEEFWLEYRKEILIIFKNISRIAPDLTVSFVQDCMNGLIAGTTNGSQSNWPEIEAVLTMLYELGEVSRVEDACKSTDQGMGKLLSIVLSSNVALHPHPCVQKIYLEIANRYSQFLHKHSHLLPQVLMGFVQAVTNSGSSVKSRACYLFLRVLKSLKPRLGPHAEALMSSLVPVLLDNQQSVSLEHMDRLYLFEATGNILGSDSLSAEQAVVYLHQIVTPILQRMNDVAMEFLTSAEQSVMVANAMTSDDVWQRVGAPLECLGWLSKGCTRLCSNENSLFRQALEVSVGVIARVPYNMGRLQSSTLLFLHRMVDCLGTGMLSFLPSSIGSMLKNIEVKGMTEVTTLINQVMSRFKEECNGNIELVLESLSERVLASFESLPNLCIGNPSQEAREYRDLYKIWLQLLQTAGLSNLIDIFLRIRSGQLAEPVIRSVVDGLTRIDEPSTNKVCIAILFRMVQRWGVKGQGGAQEQLAGFSDFFLPVVARALFTSAAPAASNANDAQCHAFLSEVSSFQRNLRTAYGARWEETLKREALVGCCGMGEEGARTYLWNMQQLSDRDFREFFIQQLQNLIVRG